MVVTASLLTVLPSGLPHRCLPSQVSIPALTGVSDSGWKVCGPEGLGQMSRDGLLSAYPTGISESEARILKSHMSNARPTSPLPLATLLDFPVVCIMVR